MAEHDDTHQPKNGLRRGQQQHVLALTERKKDPWRRAFERAWIRVAALKASGRGLGVK